MSGFQLNWTRCSLGHRAFFLGKKFHARTRYTIRHTHTHTVPLYFVSEGNPRVKHGEETAAWFTGSDVGAPFEARVGKIALLWAGTAAAAAGYSSRMMIRDYVVVLPFFNVNIPRFRPFLRAAARAAATAATRALALHRRSLLSATRGMTMHRRRLRQNFFPSLFRDRTIVQEG